MTLDSAGDLFAAQWNNVNPSEVTIFAPGASGNVAPARRIVGSNTLLQRPGFLATDTQGRLLVSDYVSGLLIFAPGAIGNVSPTVRLPLDPTFVNGPSSAEGVCTDSSNNFYWGGQPAGFWAFAANASSSSSPMSTLTSGMLNLSYPYSCFFDGNGDLRFIDGGDNRIATVSDAPLFKNFKVSSYPPNPNIYYQSSAFDSSGNMYASQFIIGNTILVFDAHFNLVRSFSSAAMNSPLSLAVH